MNNWQTFETAPKDREVLVAWGSVASGPMGHDIMKHLRGDTWESTLSGDRLPAGGYSLIAWMPLPALPNDLLSEPTKNAKQSAGSSANCN